MIEEYVFLSRPRTLINPLRYASKAASDAHFITPPVQKLVTEFGASEPLIEAPEIFNLAPSVGFQRPVTSTPGLISLAHIVFQPGKSASALEGFKALVECLEMKEQPVLAYTAMLDEENDTIRTVEMYESAEYYEEAHKNVSSSFAKAIAETQKQNKANRTGKMGAVKLKVVQGFFRR